MANTKTATRRLYCYACKRDGFRRSELTPDFLCPTCAATPGVRGYSDPNTRGLTAPGSINGPAYMNRTVGQLHVLTDDDGALPSASDGATAGVATEVPAQLKAEPLGGTLEEWRDSVYAADLASDAKVLLLKLGDYADWDGPTEGGNVRPSVRKVAEELGWSETTVRREVGKLRGRWLIVHETEVWNARAGDFARVANLYQLRWPDGRKLSAFDRRTREKTS